MQVRLLTPFLFGFTALALASLALSYSRLLHSVESAAAAAGLIDSRA